MARLTIITLAAAAVFLVTLVQVGHMFPVTVHCCHGSVQSQDCGQFRQEYCAVSEDSVILVDTGVSSAQDCQVRGEGARWLLDPVLCVVCPSQCWSDKMTFYTRNMSWVCGLVWPAPT